MMTISLHEATRRARAFAAGVSNTGIAGQKIDDRDSRMALVDPATDEITAYVPDVTIEGLDQMIATARDSFDDRRWRSKKGDERARILWRVAELLEENAQEMAALETINGGGIFMLTQMLVANAAECFRYYAGGCTRNHGISTSFPAGGITHRTELQPVGVAGLIVPWNAPLAMASWKLAPALAAGCSVILKPADETPLTALRLSELMIEAGVPVGIVSVATGVGTRLGAHLGDHAGIDKISFTGSTAVGRCLVKAAAGNMKRLTLELGGKSPFVICADADLSQAIPAAAISIFSHGGQVCTAGSRLLVARQVYDDVVNGIAEIARAIPIGSPFDPSIQLGPLVSARHLGRVAALVESGVAEGARLVQGGARQGDVGSFFQPTVFADANASMRIFSEEIFGPVVAATPFETIEEAIAIANGSIYGLAAYIWSGDMRVTHRLATEIDSGTVWVNTIPRLDYASPFGGFKQSGWGREHGPDGMKPYLETKSIITGV